jgi:hypothetical protein
MQLSSVVGYWVIKLLVIGLMVKKHPPYSPFKGRIIFVALRKHPFIL